MQKVWLLTVLIIAGFGFYSIIELDHPASVNSFVKEEGSIDVHFCPTEDCQQLTMDFLDGDEIRCAFYDLNLESLKEFLFKKDARVVIDEDNAHKVNGNIVIDSGFGLMHNKFCIVDGKKVITGSMNPTSRGTTKNDNNLILVNSEIVAAYYSAEFQELWDQNRNEKIRISPVLLDGSEMRIYFCPEDECADKIVKQLRQAQKDIHFMTFSFTHAGIANAILLRLLQGIEVKGVFERSQLNKFTMYNVMREQGADVRIDGNKYNMHHKVFIIDGETVITGSMNPTKGGDERNDENLLIIKNKKIAQQFEDEFQRVFAAQQTI